MNKQKQNKTEQTESNKHKALKQNDTEQTKHRKQQNKTNQNQL